LQSAVRQYGFRTELLKLELTEGMLVEDINGTIISMNALNQLGVKFSMDDFGTGYSSLQYLTRLPLHQIKIDRSFVSGLVTDKSVRAIVQTIIAMAGNLGLSVIAEGVETHEQRQLLQAYGCLHFQGYLFGQPVPVDTFESALGAPLRTCDLPRTGCVAVTP
jgi:EAL domain-containing protein (putative c-di-GMP-specific phosphodiesterase class I)